MAIRRLTPQVKHEELGYLRLWRDELVAMIATLRQLKDIYLYIEADEYQLDDVDSDLPNIGKSRIDEFKVIVAKVPRPGTDEILELQLSRETCYVEAVEPNPEVRGVISDIVGLASKYRRLPRWSLLSWSKWPLLTYSYIIAGAGILACLFGALLIVSPGPNAPSFSIRVWVLAIGILFLIISLPLIALSRTVIFTGTRASAPTFWQRYRAEIMIGFLVSALFYVLGLLTAH